MSYEENMQCITKGAGSDLSAAQYLFVDISADGYVDVVATKGAKALGVLQDKPAAAGRAGCIAIGGVTKVKAGAVITQGAEVISDDDGAALAQDGVSQFVMGSALETAAAAGDIIAIRMKAYQVPAA